MPILSLLGNLIRKCDIKKKFKRASSISTPENSAPANYLELPTPCIYIPSMRCSFPVLRHPLFAEIQPDSDAWALEMVGAKTPEEHKAVLCEKLVLLPCLMFPTARDSTILNIVKFVYWFTLFDTCLDHTEQLGLDHKATSNLVERYLEVIERVKPAPPNNPTNKAERFLASFASTWRNLYEDMTPGQYSRFSESVKGVLYASTSQNKLRELGIIPDAEEFLQQRRVLSGLDIAVKLLEYALGIDLKDDVRKIPDVEEIMRVANEYACCVNDMISFRPEYLRNDFHNLPCTICVSEKVSIQEAVVKTCKLIKERNDRFVELHEGLSRAEYCTDELKLFIDGLGYLMSGNLEWSWQTGRYYGSDWVAPTPPERQGIMRLHDPNDDLFKPYII